MTIHVETPAPAIDAGGAKRRPSSPLARRIAREAGIPLDTVSGSGPGGRIVRRDLDQALAAARAPQSPASRTEISVPGANAVDSVPHSDETAGRAKLLAAAIATVPNFRISVDCCADKLLRVCGQLNEMLATEEHISVNDFALRAAALALCSIPRANVIWTERALLLAREVNVAAVTFTRARPRATAIAGADQLSLRAIARCRKAAAGQWPVAMDARTRAESMAVLSIDGEGIRDIGAIVVPPQTSVLAVGHVQERVASREGHFIAAAVVTLTLSVDHRAIDGALAAEFLDTIRRLMENPMSLVA